MPSIMHILYFPSFYMHLIALLSVATYVCAPVIMSLCDYLSVCLCISTWQKFTRQEDQKLFKTLFGLIANTQFLLHSYFSTELSFLEDALPIYNWQL